MPDKIVETIRRIIVAMMHEHPFIYSYIAPFPIIVTDSPMMPTAATDGYRIFINRRFAESLLSRRDGIAKLTALLIHEALHNIFAHPVRIRALARSGVNPAAAVIAADAKVDQYMREVLRGRGNDWINENGVTLEKVSWMTSVPVERLKSMSMEEIALVLGKIASPPQPRQGMSNGNAGGGQGRQDEQRSDSKSGSGRQGGQRQQEGGRRAGDRQGGGRVRPGGSRAAAGEEGERQEGGSASPSPSGDKHGGGRGESGGSRAAAGERVPRGGAGAPRGSSAAAEEGRGDRKGESGGNSALSRAAAGGGEGRARGEAESGEGGGEGGGREGKRDSSTGEFVDVAAGDELERSGVRVKGGSIDEKRVRRLIEEGRAEELAREYASIIAARQLIASSIARSVSGVPAKPAGVGKGGLRRAVEELARGRIDWRRLVTEALEPLAPERVRRTWYRVSKKLGELRPGTIAVGGIDTAIVAIDVSGSITDEELRRMAEAVIDAVARLKPRRVELVFWDYGIQRTVRVAGRPHAVKRVFSEGTPGGGGTSITEALLRASEEARRKRNIVLIVASDWYLSETGAEARMLLEEVRRASGGRAKIAVIATPDHDKGVFREAARAADLAVVLPPESPFKRAAV